MMLSPVLDVAEVVVGVAVAVDAIADVIVCVAKSMHTEGRGGTHTPLPIQA